VVQDIRQEKEMMDLPPTLEYIGIIAGIIVGGGAGLAGVWKATKATAAGIRWIVGFSDTLTQVNENLPTMLNIAAEFRKNGGSSLRDAIDRIEKKADEAKKAAAEVKELTQQQMGLLDEIKRSVKS
jgi:uncharacterized protein YdcH (DUF465 family)